MGMGKDKWVGVSFAIIGFAGGGVLLCLQVVGVITSGNACLWLIFFAILLCVGAGILIWSFCFKKDKREPIGSSKQPFRLIPKRKIKRIVHRTETINGKTKYIEEVELDP